MADDITTLEKARANVAEVRRKAVAELAADYERHIFWNAIDKIARLQAAIEVIDKVLHHERRPKPGKAVRRRSPS